VEDPSKVEEGTQSTASEPILQQPVVTETATPKAKQETQTPAIPNSLLSSG